jgi:flagellar hook assembly protein FlgD
MVNGKWLRSKVEVAPLYFRLKDEGPRTLLNVVDRENNLVSTVLTIHNKTGVVRILPDVSEKTGFKRKKGSHRVLVNTNVAE